MRNKIWKPVKGYENYYEVSNDGEIRNIVRLIVCSNRSYCRKQKELRQYVNRRGYKTVKLYDGNAKGVMFTVHRIVALTFLENLNNYKEVNHIDYDKFNNSVENLEWCTRSHNVRHSYVTKDPTKYKGSGNKMSKLTEEQVIQMREDRKTGNFTYKQLAEKYSVGLTLVGYIINNKVWRHV
jgi:hypothetical protein